MNGPVAWELALASVVLAQEADAGAAAARLEMSPLMLWERIRRLESQMGAALLVRCGPSVMPTQSGVALRDALMPAVREFELSDLRSRQRGHLDQG